MLTRLIYHSEYHLGASDGGMISELNAIMDASQRNNQMSGLTGALIFDTLWFVQILEGERETVSQTLARIMRDPRHDNIVIMDARPIDSRQFAKWWMGLAFLRGDNAALYARHGLGTRLDPRRMSAEQTLALALDLAAGGLARSVSPHAA